LSEARPEFPPMPTTFYLYVEDCDALYYQSIAAGATSLNPPSDQPYGDRNAGVQDPYGNTWYFSTHIRDVTP
jgi:PhnB protein